MAFSTCNACETVWSGRFPYTVLKRNQIHIVAKSNYVSKKRRKNML